MADCRLNAWRNLFRRALSIIDAAHVDQPSRMPWSFGGGTVLMLQYRHRVSRDIDIFVADPQWLGHLSPRLNDRAASITADFVEQANFVKLTFDDGEIDFIAATALTSNPTQRKRIEARYLHVERPAEIIAKKVFHRATAFKARDYLDLAVVIRRGRKSLAEATSILRDRGPDLMDRIRTHEAVLREDFAALEVLDGALSYDETVETVTAYLQALRS